MHVFYVLTLFGLLTNSLQLANEISSTQVITNQRDWLAVDNK